MSERINKTSICSIIFLDIIEYSKKPVYEQIELKERFNALISEAIQDVAQNDRIILDTGDGASIAMMGAPEEALFVSLTIRDGILKGNRQHSQPLDIRIGINLGPVRVVTDINGHLNIIGDGINDAQRVMSFAEPNQILVSRSYFEITSRLSKEIAQMFSYSGIKHDKHIREHEVYLIRESDDAAPPVVKPKAVVAGSEAPLSESARLLDKKLVFGAGAVAVAVTALLVMLAVKPKAVAPAAEVASVHAPANAEAKKTEVNKPAVKAENPASKLPAAESKKISKPAVNAMPKQHKSASKKPGATKTQANAAQGQEAATKEKTQDSGGLSWDKFKESVKQGSAVPECSQAMRSMNQCQ